MNELENPYQPPAPHGVLLASKVDLAKRLYSLTFPELVVILAILAVLVGLVLPATQSTRCRGNTESSIAVPEQ
jgi:hypothetical protein